MPGDIYIRYQSYDNASDFRRALLEKVPNKIDVGAVYNMVPKLSRAYPGEVRPVQHELKFDIDISDYDDVRNCCKESNICSLCWPLMKVGAKILYKILTTEFGFKHLLFVYSGRRGFHCWVCDKVARDLSTDARKAIADYFNVVTGGQSMVKRVTINPYSGIHPMLIKSLDVIDEHFKEIMIDNQDFLANEHLLQNVIDLCEDFRLSNKIRLSCKLLKGSSERCWETMKSAAYSANLDKRNYFIEEVKLQHCFPRLDANVTRGMNHLLKLPFCIHSKTGNVCVPIDIHHIDEFDINAVPNMKNLTAESMDPYIKIMKKFVDGMNDGSNNKVIL